MTSAPEKGSSTATDQDPEDHDDGGSFFVGVGKHALIYGLGMLISRALSFVMLPVYLRALTPSEYGVMALIEMTLDFISIVGGGNLAMGVFRFYHKSDDPLEKQEIVSTSFLLMATLYVLVGTGVALGAEGLSYLIFDTAEHTLTIQVAAANLVAGSLMIVPMSLARIKDLSLLFVGANVVKLILAVAFNILFVVYMDMGVIGIFMGSGIANTVVGLSLSVWLLRGVGIRPSPRWTRDLLRFGLPLVAMQIATFTATFADRYFLQALSNEAVVGVYSLAYTFGFIMVVVGFTPLDQVWGPKRFEVAKQDNKDEMLSRGFVLLNVLLLTTGVGITMYVRDVILVMGDPQQPEYFTAYRVVPLILVAYVFASWASMQDIGILVKEQTKYLTLANIASAVVAVVGYTLLIPPYLQWGAASATVLAFVTRYVLTFYWSQKLWYVRYDWKPVLVLGAWAVVIGVVGLALPVLDVLVSLSIRTGLIAVYFAGLWMLPVLKPNEKATVLRVARQLIARVRSRGRGARTGTAG